MWGIVGSGIGGVVRGNVNPYIATYIVLIVPGGLILIGLFTSRSLMATEARYV